jgi:transcriptional regulator GlxA family with amidase domain
VDNGKIITAAGVSAGIDAALHVVGRLVGPEVAENTARYMEYTRVKDAAQEAGEASRARHEKR